MPYCSICGKEVSNIVIFCPQCGNMVMGTIAPPDSSRLRATVSREQDLLGLISVGVVLILIALTYIRYPVDLSIIGNYIQRLAEEGAFIRPPLALLDPAIFFFYAIGVWGVLLSAVRVVFQGSERNALGDLCGGFFAFFCAFLVTKYAANIFTERTMGAYFVIAVGVFVIVNVIIRFAFPEKE